MVNSPLKRPYFVAAGGIGREPLDSHDHNFSVPNHFALGKTIFRAKHLLASTRNAKILGPLNQPTIQDLQD